MQGVFDAGVEPTEAEGGGSRALMWVGMRKRAWPRTMEDVFEERARGEGMRCGGFGG